MISGRRLAAKEGSAMAFHTSTDLSLPHTGLRDSTGSRTRMLVSWLVLWIITLPLVHVHIQTDRHQGLPHNVLAGDLPGEFVPSTNNTMEGTRPRKVPTPPHFASSLSYPELAFTSPVPSTHQWLFHLTAILTREEPEKPSAAGIAHPLISLLSNNASPSSPSSPRAPPFRRLT